MKRKIVEMMEEQWRKIFLYIIMLLFFFSILQMAALYHWTESVLYVHWLPTLILVLLLIALLCTAIFSGGWKSSVEKEDWAIGMNEIDYGVIIYDRNGNVCEMNEVALDILNMFSKEQLASPFPLLNTEWEITDDQGKGILIEDMPLTVTFNTRNHSKKRTMRLSHPSLNKSIWIEASATPVLNGTGEMEKVLVGFLEITEQKENVFRLLKKNEELQVLALTDCSLNMPNSRYFRSYLTELWEFSRKSGTPVTLMIITLDFSFEARRMIDFSVGKNLLKDSAEVLRVIERYGGKAVKLDGNLFGVILSGLFGNEAIDLERTLHKELLKLGDYYKLTGDLGEFNVNIGTSSMVAVSQAGWESLLNDALSQLNQARFV
ncbi:hypothetical protein AC622_02345 [Bacillus sp. FJAT-27916]|uniref:diguanylate cyclase domain-containing protein n=1 Tax=Bacillus sp. FJAT-27916 TaxID=1679169 RepID=UPI00067130E6|nr:GGDEF domain-containing protein [Bacillus sp. FJAT-27916]KMY43238.1 hypothetical protein AC622_02345 [Bacillus sp. FJAT-27916]